MAITILDYVKTVVGDKDIYTAEDFAKAGVEMIGGCQTCAATLAPYNAYPSRSGYWRCADCIGDDGFSTVEDFTNFETGAGQNRNGSADDTCEMLLICPACGAVENITEIWENTFKCGDCGSVWRL